MSDLSPWQPTGKGGVPDVIGASRAALGAPTNGKVGLIRLGAAGDYERAFKGNGATWLDQTPDVVLQQADTWGMDLSNRDLADFRNAYCRLASSLPYGKPHTHLTVAFVVGTDTVMTVADTSSFAASGFLCARGATIAYTAKTATTFTGCSVAFGTSSGTLPANVTPIMVGLNVADVGGWGTDCIPLEFAGEMVAAGFSLQERVECNLNGGQDNTALTVAPYYWSENAGVDFVPPAKVAAGGLGFGLAVTGPASPLAANRSAERDFRVFTAGWTNLATPPSGHYLRASLYGKMPAGANDNGEVYGYTLRLRWVG